MRDVGCDLYVVTFSALRVRLFRGAVVMWMVNFARSVLLVLVHTGDRIEEESKLEA